MKELEQSHTHEAIDERLRSSSSSHLLGDCVLGAIDGTITTFAIVSSAAGAGLSSGIALTLGLANVLADGFSMGVGNFLKAKSDLAILNKHYKIEEDHIEKIPEGEKRELYQIFQAKGFSGETLDSIVEVISSDKKTWIETMLIEEYGLQLDPASPLRSGLGTFFAFLVAGIIPLIPLSVPLFLSETTFGYFFLSTLFAGITFALIGYTKGLLVKAHRPIFDALETLILGGTAAILAFTVGRYCESFIN